MKSPGGEIMHKAPEAQPGRLKIFLGAAAWRWENSRHAAGGASQAPNRRRRRDRLG